MAAKFCDACGKPLPLLCPKCGAANRAAAKFCNECGAPLGQQTQLSAGHPRLPDPEFAIGTAVDAQLTPEGERKTVTALFADIIGSTELGQDLDPEETRAIIDPALGLMIDAAQRYDGYVVQSTGDGIFALFGAPVAREDHPQRSLYTAMRMQEEIRRYSDRLRAAGRPPIQIRAGANTGEVVVRTIKTGASHTEYTPIGHTVKSCFSAAVSRQCWIHCHQRQHEETRRGLFRTASARSNPCEGDQRADQCPRSSGLGTPAHAVAAVGRSRPFQVCRTRQGEGSVAARG